MNHDVGPVPEGKEPVRYDRLRRRVLWLLPTGLYLLGTRAESRRNLMTISWVTQVAMEPKLVAVSVQRDAVTHQLLDKSGVFALSVLSRADRAVVRKFVKPVEDQSFDETSHTGTMQGLAVEEHSTGVPVLGSALAWLDCEVREKLALGSHSLFVGEVVDCDWGALGAGEDDVPHGDEADEALQVLRMEDTRMNYGG